MTWSELFLLLDDEERRFASKAPRWILLAPNGPLIDRYEDLMLEQADAVDKAIRQFARKRTWPEMTKQQIAALRIRLDFAIDLTTLFGQSNVQVPGLDTDKSQIEWLLIYAWSWAGFGGMTRNLASLLPEDFDAIDAQELDADGHVTGSI